MKTFIALIALSTTLVSTAYAHHAIDLYSWQKPIQETINIPTEHIVYEDTDALTEASALVVDATWTGARKTKESSAGSVYTISQIKISKWVKGKTDKKIVIVEPAYVLDGVLYQYDHYTYFEKGVTYRLYLTKVKGNWTLINPTQGRTR